MMTLAPLLVLALSAPQAGASGPPAAAPAPSTEDLGRAYYLYVQGLSLEGRDDAAAVVSYREALGLLPNSATIHAELAGVYARQGQNAEATAEARSALALDGTNREAHRLLGWMLAGAAGRDAEGDAANATLDEAVDHLQKARVPGGNDLSLDLILSELYLRRHRGTDAVPVLNGLLEDRPGYAPGLRMLVEAYRQLGDSAQADKTLDTLNDGPPDTTAVRIAQIERSERQGDWRSAAAGWEDLIAAEAGARIYRPQQALALMNNDQMAEARALMQQVVHDWPRDVSSWYVKAQIDAEAKDWPAANDAVLHVQTLDPTDLRGPLALAAVRTAQGNVRGAIQALEPRLNAPREADVASGRYLQAVGALARAYADTDQPKKAVELLERAQKRVPDDDSLRFSLAAAYENNKQFDLAEQMFRQIISANPNQPSALNYLGYMLAERGQKLDEAVDLIKKALAIDRNNPAYLDSLGWAYFRKGDFDQALGPLERAAAGLPKVSVIQDHLGDLYVQLKRYQDAVTAFEHALAGDRDGIDAGDVTRKRDRARALVPRP
jgi:tetratricopeptide (TPR) repeat protein